MAEDEDRKAEEAQLAAERKKPIEERVGSSLWKARVEAFEHIQSKCDAASGDSDPIIAEAGDLFVRGVGDSNAATQDKALGALKSWLEKASDSRASRIAEEVLPKVVKCLKGRPGTVKRAEEVSLMFIELEQAAIVVDCLVAAFKDKVPKVVQAAVDVVTAAISSFGAKAVPAPPIMKALPPLFDSKDGKVREKAKNLVVELGRWLGKGLIEGQLMEKMRDAMKKDVEACLSEQGTGKLKPARFTRKEAARRAKAEQQKAAAAVAETAVGGRGRVDLDSLPPDAFPPENASVVANGGTAIAQDEDEDEDLYDDFPAEDIVPQLQKGWWGEEGVESKKWASRRQALVTLKALATKPRLAPGKMSDLLAVLKKVIAKDSNVQCVAEALLCVAALAKGLRSNFQREARSTFLGLALDKLKEKNANVNAACHKALGSMHRYSVKLEDVQDDISAMLTGPNPKVKEECLVWLKSCFSREPKSSLAGCLPNLAPVVVKLSSDGSVTVRDRAVDALVALAQRMGGAAPLEKYLAKMDDKRRKVLDDSLAGTRKPAVLVEAGKAKATSNGSVRREPSPRSSGAPAASSSSSPPGRGEPRSARPAREAARPAAADAEAEEAASGPGMTAEEAEAKLAELFGPATVSALQDVSWKARVEAMEAVLERTQSGTVDGAAALVQAALHLPGLGDKHFQVVAKLLELVAHVAAQHGGLGKREVAAVVAGLAEKMSDVKLKRLGCECLSSMAEVVGLTFVIGQLHKKAAVHKNPKVLSEALVWIAAALQEFGMKAANTKSLLEMLKGDLGHANAGVRSAAIAVLGVMHGFLGPPLREMLAPSVKPALMTAVDAEFEQNPRQTGFQPTRHVRSAAPAAAGSAARSSAAASVGRRAAEAPADAEAGGDDDLLPREDISGRMTPKLMDKLGNANWKLRKEALDEIEAVLTEAGNRIQPQVGELFAALKGRMSDSNKNLVATALQLLAKIARAMGAAFEKGVRPVSGAALKNISDNKAVVRAAVLELVQAWSGVAGPQQPVAELCSALAAPKCSADGKQEAISWMRDLADTASIEGCEAPLAKAAAIGCSDKTIQVRTVGQQLLGSLVGILGSSEVQKEGSSLSSELKKVLTEALAKLPAGAAPPTAAVPAARAVSRAATVRASAPSRPASAQRSAPARPGTAASRSAAGALDSGADEPLLTLSEGKDERQRKAGGPRMRTAKWEAPKAEELEQLQAELALVARPSLMELLFAKDFKQHCAAAQQLQDALPDLYDEVVSCMDLLLRWAASRICEEKLQSFLKVLELVAAVFTLAAEREYTLTQYEAEVLFPCLIEKSGHNQASVRKATRDILRQACAIFSTSRLLSYLTDGLESKNNRTRGECAEMIGDIFGREGVQLLAGAGPLKKKLATCLPTVAQLAAERDNALRQAALQCLGKIYEAEGEVLWELIDETQLSGQAAGLIRERMKSIDKDLAKKGLAAGYKKRERDGGAEEGPADGGGSGAEPELDGDRKDTGSSMSSGPAAVAAAAGARLAPGETRWEGAALRTSESLPQAGPWVPGPASIGSVPPGAPPPAAAQPAAVLSPRTEDEQLENWTKGVVQLSDHSLAVNVEGMKLLCYELMEAQKGASPLLLTAMKSSTDELVHALAQKTQLLFKEGTENTEMGKDNPTRGCKYLLNTLMQVFTIRDMAQKVEMGTLVDIITQLLLQLLDGGVAKMKEGSQLLRALNVLMLRILENSRGHLVFGALLELLRNPPESAMATPDKGTNFYDLAIKCLIKKTKALSSCLDSIQLDELLLHVHYYFAALGVEEIRRRSSREDKPLRMVKTILYECCKIKGEEIFQYTRKIPRSNEGPQPIIMAYIDLNLKTLQPATRGGAPADAGAAGPVSSAAAAPANGSGGQAGSPDAAPQPSPRRGRGPQATAAPAAASNGSANAVPAQPSRTTLHQHLPPETKAHISSIFKKIGDRNLTEEGLNDLFLFKQQNPTVDLDGLLNTTSEAFRSYIHKGLLRVAQRHGAPPAPANGAGARGPPARQSSGAMDDLRSRMERIQQGVANMSQAARERSPYGDVAALEERMNRLKN